MSVDQLLAWLPPDSPDAALALQLNPEQLPGHVAGQAVEVDGPEERLLLRAGRHDLEQILE